MNTDFKFIQEILTYLYFCTFGYWCNRKKRCLQASIQDGTYLSKRIVKLDFSDGIVRLSIHDKT